MRACDCVRAFPCVRACVSVCAPFCRRRIPPERGERRAASLAPRAQWPEQRDRLHRQESKTRTGLTRVGFMLKRLGLSIDKSVLVFSDA
eukprot:6201852-Pleurochrysis_carterae.AAC.1